MTTSEASTTRRMMPGAVLLLLFALAGSAAAVTVTITECGQTVPDLTTGVLAADLVCTSSATSVFVGERGKLKFDGHTIRAGGVWCQGSCTLKGPGAIEDALPWTEFGNNAGIVTNKYEAKVVVKELAITNCFVGIATNAAKVTLKDVAVRNSVGDGVSVYGRTRATDLTVTDNGGTGLIVSYGASIVARRLTATGNGAAGLNSHGTRTRLLNSTLTGNSYPPFPGLPTAIDLISTVFPELVNTTCGQSWHSGGPWGVCSGD